MIEKNKWMLIYKINLFQKANTLGLHVNNPEDLPDVHHFDFLKKFILDNTPIEQYKIKATGLTREEFERQDFFYEVQIGHTILVGAKTYEQLEGYRIVDYFGNVIQFTNETL